MLKVSQTFVQPVVVKTLFYNRIFYVVVQNEIHSKSDFKLHVV